MSTPSRESIDAASGTGPWTIPANGNKPYDVVIGHDLVGAIGAAADSYSKVGIIHQPTVAVAAHRIADTLAARDISSFLVEIDDAEQGKTFDVITRCWDECAKHGVGRRDAIISVGGGAATDVGGFVAATWMRGIDVIQVPTTVLGMVDAAVGGKTGINTPAGKNLVGAFHEPSAVFVDLDFINNLPREAIVAGSAEIVKTGFIADTEITKLYERDPDRCLDVAGDLPELIRRSIAVKASVVSQDLKESSLREILNYGHTFGHAIEKVEHYRWPHGHAVAVGMCFEAELACVTGHLSDAVVQQHRTILQSLGLPTHYDAAALDDLIDAMKMDKKNRDGKIRFVILSSHDSDSLDSGTGSGLSAADNSSQVPRPIRLAGPSYEDLQTAFIRMNNRGEP